MKGEWTEGSVQDFLGLSDAEAALVETRVSLTRMLRASRASKRMTQTRIAQAIGTSQSRIAKIESGDRKETGTREPSGNSKPLVILSGEIKTEGEEMDKAKRDKLEKAGLIVTNASEWLGLSKEEEALVEMRVNLAREVERLRRENGVTQKAIARSRSFALAPAGAM